MFDQPHGGDARASLELTRDMLLDIAQRLCSCFVHVRRARRTQPPRPLHRRDRPAVPGIAASLPNRWDAAPLALPAWIRLRRLLARFAALVAAVEAGRFPAAGRTTAAASRPRPAAPAIRLPGGSGWLLRLAPALETRLGRAQLESLLADPELGALLAQAPQAGRILRPLCHMLRIEPPPSLRLPRRPRRPGPFRQHGGRGKRRRNPAGAGGAAQPARLADPARLAAAAESNPRLTHRLIP